MTSRRFRDDPHDAHESPSLHAHAAAFFRRGCARSPATWFLPVDCPRTDVGRQPRLRPPLSYLKKGFLVTDLVSYVSPNFRRSEACTPPPSLKLLARLLRETQVFSTNPTVLTKDLSSAVRPSWPSSQSPKRSSAAPPWPPWRF